MNPSRANGCTANESHITQEMKDIFKDLLHTIKNQIIPGTEVVPAEVEHFVRRVMTRWSPGDSHKAPTRRSADAGFEDTASQVGILLRNLPTAGATKAARKAVNKDKVFKKQPNGAQNHSERMAGAPIYMRADTLYANATPSFQLTDGRGRVVSNRTLSLITHTKKTLSEMYFEAMKCRDNHTLENILNYNIRMAVYVAREKLTLWAQEGTVNIPSNSDDESLNFIPMFLFCNLPGGYGDDIDVALERLRKLTAPTLSEGF